MLSDRELKELKDLVEGKATKIYNDQMVAKEDLDIVAAGVEETYGIKKAVFKKIVTMHYKDTIDEEKEKAMSTFELCEEILNEIK